MKRISILISLLGFLFCLYISNFSHTLFAQSASDLQAQINSKTTEIQALEKEIAQYQSQLDQVGQDKKTLTNAITTLDIEKKKLLTDIKITETKINSANLSLGELSNDIDIKSNTIVIESNALKKNVQKLYALDRDSLLEVFLSKDKISDSWRDVASLVAFQKQFGDSVKNLSTAKKTLEDNKAKIENVKADLVSLKSESTDQKKIVDQTAAEKAALLKQTKAKESNYSTLLADKLARKAQFEQDLRSYESQLKFILDPSSIPAAGSSALAWPLDTIKITQLFGKTVASQRLYVSGSHNGVDFGAPIGTPAKAMASGKVIGSGNTDLACPGASYGNWILIAYDNGLTSVYGHLSLVKAAVGDRVALGQVVAYTGSTGYSTGPHLHVSLWPSKGVEVAQVPSHACSGHTYTQPVAATNAYLDPILYLPKVLSSMVYYK